MAPARWHHARVSFLGTVPSTATRTCSGCASCAAPARSLMRRPGTGGNLSSTAMPQPWLVEPAKIWALADLPRRRGRSGGDKTRHYLSSLAFLSGSLRQRADHGEDPAALGRPDMELFLNRPGYLYAAGEISELTRVLGCREVRKLLTSARQLGATRPGGPAAGLSDQFSLHPQRHAR